jgi:hypothetical protein
MLNFKTLPLTCLVFSSLLGIDDKVDFAREVLPILSNKCYACHGPDTKDEKLVRLDLENLAKKDLGGYHAIDPANLEESELLYRIVDEDDPMPPDDFGKTLTKNEKQVIRKWVISGAEYAQHWSFVPPAKVEFLADGNPVDYFIGKSLKDEGIDFAIEADRATLARRASLVLNGLPPEPEELKSFLEDGSPHAYERFLDNLFEKIDYGEHIARYWLDAVRYGDTHGLHLDNRRGIYPYRDWVVRSFNNNQPIDEFIQWQLAGDLFSEPTEEQLIATGYVRMNPTTGEGGAIPAEFQAKNNFDRVETTGTALLGLSLTCARCHTHKYDPITHQEYFEFLAFFNNTAEHSMDGNKYEYGDHITVPKDHESRAKWEALLKEEKKLLEKIRKSEKFDDAIFDLANLTALMTPDLSRPSSKVVGSSKNTPKTQTPKHAIDDNLRTKYLNYDAKGSGLTIHTLGGVINGLSLTSAEDVPGRDPSAYKLEGSVNGKQFVLISQGDVPHFKKRNQKHEIFFDNNRSFKSYRITFPKLADIYAKEMQISEVELLKADTVSNDPILEEAKKLHIEMTEGRKSLLTTTLVARELPDQRKRVTQILNRGEYNQPIGEPLSPGVFSVLGTMPKSAPANRMGLVDWLTDKKNPLTARVLVNRFWVMVFGEGLVRTPEEFGLQGEHPTHPELLDWLAVDFQENGWDLKRLLKQMMISKTFQQSSKHRVELNDPENKLWGRGPSYRLDAEVLRDLALWSGGLLNRKLGGEGVKPYQPSGMWKALSHPASNTKNYIPDEDDRIYRRSLYLYWKRTSPHPMMTLFDAPSRETSCVQRSRTNTSLQSLAFFNETQRVEASRKLAERLLREKKEDKHRIDFLFQILASRKPSQIEHAALAGLLDSARSRFSNFPESAESLLSIGLAKLDSSLDSRDVAAWTQVSSTVLASDPVILLY